MPELPDLTAYVQALGRHAVGHRLDTVRVMSPFVVRSVDPPVKALEGLALERVGRLGKQLVLSFEQDLHAVVHLMIAGRLRWRKVGAKAPGRQGLMAFDWPHGTLLFTEASSKKRASIHLVRGAATLEAFDRGGIEPLEADVGAFGAALRRENRTLKRALTSPDTVAGVGNAYSDEILHAARMSPMKRTRDLSDEGIECLHAATRDVLTTFSERIRDEVGDGFPDKVTAFREDFAVHGRYQQPCPVCGEKVRRIVKGSNEFNYCPTCQTGGKVLADRALSKLFRGEWPSQLEDWE